MEKFRRHLAALMRKNFLLKRRHPCSLCCELLLAISATGLLVVTRALVDSHAAVRKLPTNLFLERSMPVRLPECAEYVVECAAELMKDREHSPLCIKGVTYGCQQMKKGIPAVWVAMGCNGTFAVGEGSRPVKCRSGKKGMMHLCPAVKQPPSNLLRQPYEDESGRFRRETAELPHCPAGFRHAAVVSKLSSPTLVPFGKCRDSCLYGTEKCLAFAWKQQDFQKDVLGACRTYSEGSGEGQPLAFEACPPDSLCCIRDSEHPDSRRLRVPFRFHPKKQIRERFNAHGMGEKQMMGAAGQGHGMIANNLATLMTTSGTASMRRFQAQFGIVGPGSSHFVEYLERTGHPWASSIKLFASPAALDAYLAAPEYPQLDPQANRTSSLCGAVVFETSPESEKVKYTLRFNTTLAPDPSLPPLAGMMMSTRIKTDELVDTQKEGKMPGQFDGSGMMWYTQSGFMALQRTVDTFLEELATSQKRSRRLFHHSQGPAIGGGSFFQSMLGDDARPHIVVPMPVQAREQEVFAMAMPGLLGLFLLISLAFSVNRMITAVVHEREAKLRDGMRMMGMHSFSFYASWILTYMIIYLFVTTGVVLCLTVGRILPNSSPSLLFVWIILFSSASISYALMITTFFSRAKTAATVGSIAFFASSYLMHLARPSSSPEFLRLLQLLPPVSFQLVAKSIASLESQGIGVVWANAGHPFHHVSAWDGCCMLAFDTVVLFLLFLYFDQTLPQEFGLRRPWYFPVLPSFWREVLGKSSPRKVTDAAVDDDAEAVESSALVEKELGEAAAMMARSGQIVELNGLSKSFGEVLAVRSLSLVMYQGEIFALLGHNGAGKTTTFGMLCGLMPPTRGKCIVFGHDLASEPGEVQKVLGVCPQHDVLWPELTGQEHLTLFAGFKGVPRASVKDEVASMLQRVGLQGAFRTQAGNLSGGMKRKLSLAIAFLGGSQLVVLDEPTSGLDPYSRRMVWELLRAMKQGRVTVLSTHYMDEADILGDRIAIMHEGALKCCGTPQFLKRAYDCGYNVTLVKRPGCQTDAVREALIRHMPELASEVVTLSDSANELMLQFPFAAARHFPVVLGGLEQNMASLCVESYGISVTTLEEVFLKVASGERVERQHEQETEETVTSDAEYVQLEDVQLRVLGADQPSALVASEGQYAKVELRGCRRFFKHMCALLTKRWRYGMRDRRGLFCQLFLPTGTLLILLAIISRVLFHNMPTLTLDAAVYNAHCENTPQNLVEFTHLPSVDPKEATELMESGNRFWKGETRRHAPGPASKYNKALEKSLFSTFPSMALKLRSSFEKTLKHSDRIKSELEDEVKHDLKHQPKDPLEEDLTKIFGSGKRRLREREFAKDTIAATIETHLWDLGMEWWAAYQRSRMDTPDWMPFFGEDGTVDVNSLGSHVAKQAIRRLQETFRRDGMEKSAPKVETSAPEIRENWGSQNDPNRAAFDLLDDLFDDGEAPNLHHTATSNRTPTFELPKDWQAAIAELGKNVTKEFANVTKDIAHRFPHLDKTLHKMRRNFSDILGLDTSTLDDFESLRNLPELQELQNVEAGRGFFEHWQHVADPCKEIHPSMNFLWLAMRPKDDRFVTWSEFQSFANSRMKRPPDLAARIAEHTLFNLFDQDHDGKISKRDFCIVGAAFQAEVEHYTALATNFSWQLCNSSAPCPRYGAFYILQGPRDHSSKWQAIADAVLFVNTSSSHSAPTFQAAFTNARFARLGLNKQVEVNTHPFPQTPSEQKWMEKIAVFMLAIYITFSLSFIPSGIAHFVVKERETGARQLQVLSGVSNICYWFSNLLFDVTLYIVPAVSIPYALHSYGFSMLLEGECGLAVVCVLVAFGPAIAGFTYIVSFLFKDHSKAANMILMFCLVGAVVLSIVLFFLAIVNFDPMAKYPTACEYPTDEFPEGTCRSPKSRIAERILSPIFHLVPTVCVYQALFSIALVANLKAVVPEEAMKAFMAAAGEHAPKVSLSPFAWEWAGQSLTYLAVEAFAYLFVVVALDTCLNSPRLSKRVDAAVCRRSFRAWRARRSTSARSDPLADAVLGNLGEGSGDDCVEQERERVACLQPDAVALHISRLEKSYLRWLSCRTPAKDAVRGVSLAVNRGEVLGFLGHNGAGKTSALKCLIGELCSTAGDIHVGGFHMEKQSSRARQQIGYCPQFDALLELLTVQDHLEFYAALKGLPAAAVGEVLKDFGLEKNRHRRADVLSGGNKRKLSAAIALLGHPCLAVLDEPSCGLDPASRRALWGAVHCAVDGTTAKTSAVLLTTHSMEEAEALSTRLGIIAEGRLLTVGTSQQVKQRHGSSHELCFSLMTESQELLSATLQQLGNGALQQSTRLDMRSIGPLLDADAWKKQAYSRPRCVIRAQIESVGCVEASVLVEWWLQQARGEVVEKFLKSLLGDGIELAENFGPYWRFRLPFCASVGLPQMFEQLEGHAQSLGIAEYTLTQATLEQIFNSMAQDVDAERQAMLAA